MKKAKIFLQIILAGCLLGYPAFLLSKNPTTMHHAIKCLADNAWHEARGEGPEGMQAVIEVTLNRVQSGKYKPYICSVVHQHRQFSWTNTPRNTSKKPKKAPRSSQNLWEVPEYQYSLTLAKKALEGNLELMLDKDVIFYHNTKVNPKWNRKMTFRGKIGNHLFYSYEKETQ